MHEAKTRLSELVKAVEPCAPGICP
jgi:antitoxin (DNA-binding transcriptional repressor) of toxin-antitoxin stability system